MPDPRPSNDLFPPSGEALCWMALTFAPDVGAVAARRLADCFGSAAAVLRTPVPQLVGAGRVTPAVARQIAAIAANFDQVSAAAETMGGEGIRLLLLDDPDYPANLAPLRDAPPALYLRGDPQPSDERAVAVVGTRQPSEAGAQAARLVARTLAQEDITIVSGLALGIDAAAHAGALETGRTLAALGSGLSNVYPARHRPLADAVARQGALFSERPPDASPARRHLLARNRLIAGLARAVLVVQVRSRGGSFTTARHALRLGRPVFVMGWPEPEFAAGAQRLAQMGAHSVTHASDLAAIAMAASLPLPEVEQPTLDDLYDDS